MLRLLTAANRVYFGEMNSPRNIIIFRVNASCLLGDITNLQLYEAQKADAAAEKIFAAALYSGD